MTDANPDLRDLIRTIPDFPKPGIQFRDITTLLLDPAGFAATIDRIAALIDEPVDLIASVEARGFTIGAALAYRMKTGLLLIRKDGKLPGETIGEDYALEYGTDRLTMHVDACAPGARVLLVDDLLATGGTALAAIRLIRQAGATVLGAAFIVELPDLGGRARLEAEGCRIHHLVEFEGD